ncbi:hypothetical protein [Nocardia veterana]|uniref:Uncharacterized protein n=1 Tax=Nocardia veterana TaxID=132249 RepID=A0A7X6M222_9NOCA|nr:hypothetical protein [Nocardia veterana]NKY88854.1 hypothetical protein [Nocardia veterana]
MDNLDAAAAVALLVSAGIWSWLSIRADELARSIAVGLFGTLVTGGIAALMWSSGHTAYLLTASVITAVQLANLAILGVAARR